MLIKFHCPFPYLVKYYHIVFIIIVFWLCRDRLARLIPFVPALLLSILTSLFLPSSSVSLSYFILAVPMRECLGKHSCMSSPFPISVFLDIKKAFDAVDHKIILSKFDFYWIREVSHEWLKSYLSERYQITVIYGITSFSSISHGVPQGSVLGPL